MHPSPVSDASPLVHEPKTGIRRSTYHFYELNAGSRPLLPGSMTEILSIRHRETQASATGHWQGWSDPPLTPPGRAQAEAIACRLAAERAQIAALLLILNDASHLHVPAD
jgi:hypothetical protein